MKSALRCQFEPLTSDGAVHVCTTCRRIVATTVLPIVARCRAFPPDPAELAAQAQHFAHAPDPFGLPPPPPSRGGCCG